MNIKQIVEFCFRHEQCILRAVEEKRLDSGVTVGGGGHCKMSDPTAMKAITNVSDIACVEVEYGAEVNGRRNIMPLRKPLKWLKVAAWTKEYYSARTQGEIIRLKYNESMLPKDICQQLNISTATYYAMLSDIFAYAAGVARGLNIIR